MTYFNVLLGIHLKELRKTTKNPRIISVPAKIRIKYDPNTN